jgi:hypothetical protein
MPNALNFAAISSLDNPPCSNYSLFNAGIFYFLFFIFYFLFFIFYFYFLFSKIRTEKRRANVTSRRVVLDKMNGRKDDRISFIGNFWYQYLWPFIL